ncbi:MAG: prepilin-type N-terminal cleavage/methylation domain-containing protein [Deltaproteobacteria bacterium]|nr:prepilin-type N-terminal cleavage/methylation domain-containing protein [Deltaproteobacteria bacterium]
MCSLPGCSKTLPRRALTLLELLLVLAILGTLAAIGWGSLRAQVPRYRLVEAGSLLAENVQTLRVSAITSSRETRLVLDEADPDPGDASSWGGSWWMQAGNRSAGSTAWEFLPIDADDGTDDDQGEGRVDIGRDGNHRMPGVGLARWAPLKGPGTENGDAIVFTPRGWVANPAADFDAQGYITLQLVNKRAEGDLEDAVLVRIARSGYVRMESTLGADPEAVGPPDARGSAR